MSTAQIAILLVPSAILYIISVITFFGIDSDDTEGPFVMTIVVVVLFFVLLFPIIPVKDKTYSVNNFASSYIKKFNQTVILYEFDNELYHRIVSGKKENINNIKVKVSSTTYGLEHSKETKVYFRND